MHGGDAQITALPPDLGGEIDFVMRRPDAGTELDDQLGRARTKLCFHQTDGFRHDAEFRSFFSGMDQADRLPNGIDQINRAAIGDVNTQANAGLVCDQAVTAVNAFIIRDWFIENADAIPMNLLRRYERRPAQSGANPYLTMNRIQPGQRLCLVVRNLHARETRRKTVNHFRPRRQRRELLSRKLTRLHLLVVVRVEVRVSV